ncbi:hypothetical protein ACS0TY_007585 [Phlomoides rotata]
MEELAESKDVTYQGDVSDQLCALKKERWRPISSLAKKLVQIFDELLHKAKKNTTLEEVRKVKKSEVRYLPYDKK